MAKGLTARHALSTTVFLLVLFAAFLHAAWNVQIKLNLDRFLGLFLLQVGMGAFGLAMLGVVGLPARSSIPYALVSGLLHTAYNLFLARSYKTGDLSLVYPLARGGAPFLTLLGTVFISHDIPSPLATTGILVLLAGLLMAGLSGLRRRHVEGRTLFFAGGTAVFIAVYTVVDGLGGRVSGDPIAYAGLVFVLDSLLLFVTGLWLRGPAILGQVLPYWKSGLAGAGASSLAYAIVIWAMAQAPIATVAALRETGIIFALAMSARYLKEALTPPRIIGAFLIAAGAILLRLG
jgi:drug/metabolite transporter (DMT)-like permease